MFLARFYDRRFEDARESAARALAFNPYSAEIKGRIGGAFILRGDYAAGLALLKQAATGAEHSPPWLGFYHFLQAWMQNDFAGARRHAARTTAGRTPLGLIAKILVARQDSDANAQEKWTEALRHRYPRFAQDVSGAFERMAMAQDIRKRLLDDLAAAGFPAVRPAAQAPPETHGTK